MCVRSEDMNCCHPNLTTMKPHHKTNADFSFKWMSVDIDWLWVKVVANLWRAEMFYVSATYGNNLKRKDKGYIAKQ